MSDITVPDAAVEAAARALRFYESSGMCELGRVCALCDCIDPKTSDEYARLHARKVLEAGFKELGFKSETANFHFNQNDHGPRCRYVTDWARIEEGDDG